MKQVFHIFAKDTRRFWPEILLTLATLAALVIVYRGQWKAPAVDAGTPARLWIETANHFTATHQAANTFCSLLVLMAWALLILRAVHEESPVGDRQFWITRPYEWQALLGAKLLFLAVYLYPPLAAAQCICLASAGVNPLDGIASIAYYLFLLTGLAALPLMAIAAVTENQSKAVFGAVGVLAGGVAIAAIWFRQIFYANAGMQPRTYWKAAAALAALSAVVIALEYATRRTALARTILIAGAAGLAAYAHFTASPARPAEVQGSDFTPVAQPPFQVSLREQRPIDTRVTEDWKRQPVVDVEMPMDYAAAGDDRPIHLEMFGVEFEAPDGFRWSTLQNSFWIWPTEYQGKTRFFPGFFVPYAVYERLKQSPATLKLTFYYDDLQATDTVQSSLSEDGVKVAGGTYCGIGFSAAWRRCRSAAWQTPIVNASARFSVDPCPAAQPELEEGAGPGWSGFGYGESSQPNLVPLREFSFSFARNRNNAAGGKHLCSGAPISFTHYRIAGRKQATFTLPNVQLPQAPGSIAIQKR